MLQKSTKEDLYDWGVLAEIKQQLQLPNGAIRLLVEGLQRVQLTEVMMFSKRMIVIILSVTAKQY